MNSNADRRKLTVMEMLTVFSGRECFVSTVQETVRGMCLSEFGWKVRLIWREESLQRQRHKGRFAFQDLLF